MVKNEAGDFIGLVAINRDITDQKLADERFRLAVEAAPNAIIMVNQNGEIILTNSQAEKFFGYQRDELIGANVDKLVPMQYTAIHPNHRADFLSAPQMRDMGAGRDLYALRKDGSEFPVEIGLAPIETQEGLYVLATIVDITERRQAEEELHRLNKELESFASSISHDLRAPLRSIRFEIAEQIEGWCDAGLIRIVFQNLLGNSVKFTSKRTDTLVEFGRRAKKKFGKKVYFVRDNGAGFDMAYADKMFNAFQRLHTVDEFPGTGIGLATIQRIIHRHGGQIWVGSCA